MVNGLLERIKNYTIEIAFERFSTPKYKVIINGETTILINNITGKKYISRPHQEPFDIEKGLLMCLAKDAGITHSELKKMIANASIQDTKKKQ